MKTSQQTISKLDLSTSHHIKASENASCALFLNQNRYTYTWSDDTSEINAYIYLRQQRYQAVHHQQIEIDEYDKPGYILIAKRGNKVIGGIRLTIASVNTPLPLETYGLNYKHWVPEMAKLPHCELSRLCVTAKETKTQVSRQLISKAIKVAIAKGCQYMFATSANMYLNHYKHLFSNLGYQLTVTTHGKDVLVGETPIQLCFVIVDLQHKLLSNPLDQSNNHVPELTMRAKL